VRLRPNQFSSNERPMGQIHKIGDEYYVEFMARGLKYQQKAGPDYKKAEELLRQIEEKIAKGELLTVVREIAREAFFADFLKFAQTQYHPHTIRRLELAIAHFENFLNENLPDIKMLAQITPRVIEDYKTAHIRQRSKGGLNPKIINLTLLLLREVLEYGIKTGYINDNPTLHIRLLDVPAARPLRIPDGTLSKIVDHSPEVYRNVFLFLRHTGLRLHELEALNWQQVDLNRNVIFIKYREVPLNATALMIVKKAFHNVIDHKATVFLDDEGEALGADEIAVRFHKAAGKAGLASLSAVCLRHSFACDLLQMRLSFLSVGKILGIHDVAKLMFYASCIPAGREDILKGVHGA
jgi:site-specific recombinase XerD